MRRQPHRADPARPSAQYGPAPFAPYGASNASRNAPVRRSGPREAEINAAMTPAVKRSTLARESR